MTDEREKLDKIGAECAEVFGCTLSDILSPTRDARIMDARSVAMWITAKLMPHLSRRRISHGFGRRDAHSVADGIKRVDEMRLSPRARSKVDKLYNRFYQLYGKAPEPKDPHADDEPIGGGHDAAWGFVGFHAQGGRYFEEQNDKFASAMMKAGYKLQGGP